MIGTATKARRYAPAVIAGTTTLLMSQPIGLAQDRSKAEPRARHAIELLAGYDYRAAVAFSTRSFADLDALNRDLRRTIIARGEERAHGTALQSNCDGSIFGLSALVQRAVLKLKNPDRFATAYDDNASATLGGYARSLHRCARDAGLDTFETALTPQAVKAL